ncbi:MAG: DUF3011 domain-containing protein [Luteimonas sp.]
MRMGIISALTIAVAGLACAGASAQGYSGNDGGTVRCESSDGRTRVCSADTDGGVRLNRQLSNQACVEGRNWGYDGRGIWVSNGCRAEFQVGGGWAGGGGWNGRPGSGWNGNGVLRCESKDRRTQQCAADTRGGVRLVRQLSDNRCIEGRTWGSSQDVIWVSNGCRAEFQTSRGGGLGSNGYGNEGYGNDDYNNSGYGSGGYGNGPGMMRCESSDHRVQECRASARGGVRLVRQLSDTRCIEGRTWGYSRDRIWVSNGCRAVFQVDGYRRNDY